MSCSEWCLDISAYLDGNLESARSRSVERHLKECAACASFYAEQHELNQVLRATLPDLEPPPQIWHRIEAQLVSRPAVAKVPKPWNLLGLFRIPRLGYAGAVLVLMVGLFIFDTPSTGGDDERYLAELEAFSIEVKGNPFLRDVQAENPFFKLGQYESGNPFERLGGSQQ